MPLITSVLRAIASSFHPYALMTYKMKKGNAVIFEGMHGEVLEVGAGDGARKHEYLKQYPNIKNYTATDFSSWDNEFEKINTWVERYGRIAQALTGFGKRIPPDKICDATNLPFAEGIFDYHISIEVLEHIDNPEKYFREATRVVRTGGVIAFCVPFLFRMHGGEPNHEMDHFRYANGFFHRMARENNLDLVRIFHNTGYGTTMATLTNGWIVRRIIESHLLIRIPLFILSPFIFLLTNALGFLIDLSPDKRFASRWHVIMRKK